MFDRQLSRRDMIRTGAAAVAAASFPSLLTAKADEPVVGFTLAIQSYTFRNFKLDKAVAKIAECGVKHVEFFRNHVPIDSKPEQIKAVLKLCGDHGITPVAFGVEPYSKNHDENKKRFEFRGRPRRQMPDGRSDQGRVRQSRQALFRVQDRHRHPSARSTRRHESSPVVVCRGHHEGREGPQRVDRHLP